MHFPYKFKLSEEISRWVFEIVVEKSSSWFLAFTNPTAGPWKKVSAPDQQNNFGEVFRFGRERTRPDLIIVNDKLEIVIIIEAKDKLAKLNTTAQLTKSSDVVLKMAETLSKIKDNPFWGNRGQYTYVHGFLWGSEGETTQPKRENLFSNYLKILGESDSVDVSISDTLVAFEIYPSKEKNSLDINFFFSSSKEITDKISQIFFKESFGN